jgi:hypothetical protein
MLQAVVVHNFFLVRMDFFLASSVPSSRLMAFRCFISTSNRCLISSAFMRFFASNRDASSMASIFCFASSRDLLLANSMASIFSFASSRDFLLANSMAFSICFFLVSKGVRFLARSLTSLLLRLFGLELLSLQ